MPRHTPAENIYSLPLYAGILLFVFHHFDVILRPLRRCVPQQTPSGILTLR